MIQFTWGSFGKDNKYVLTYIYFIFSIVSPL